jgi:hypothetical protein
VWKIEECIDSATRQETQLAVLETTERVLYTVQSIRNVLHYDVLQKEPESYGSVKKLREAGGMHRPELDGTRGNAWNTLEATVSYSAWARLTPTLTHVVAYELATSGAEDGAMSGVTTRTASRSWYSAALISPLQRLTCMLIALTRVPCVRIPTSAFSVCA